MLMATYFLSSIITFCAIIWFMAPELIFLDDRARFKIVLFYFICSFIPVANIVLLLVLVKKYLFVDSTNK